MGPVIELCRRCGFEIPSDARDCPGCGPEPVPCLAALQLAGLALPTRSVHRLPATPPRRDVHVRRLGPARGARSAFECTSLLVVLALIGAVLSWAARLDRYVPILPRGSVERIDAITEAVTWASVIVLAVGLAAMGAWTVRRLALGVAGRRRHDAHA